MANQKKPPIKPRKAAKPAVINLKATEVKARGAAGDSDKTADKPADRKPRATKVAPRPAGTKKQDAEKPAVASKAQTKAENKSARSAASGDKKSAKESDKSVSVGDARVKGNDKKDMGNRPAQKPDGIKAGGKPARKSVKTVVLVSLGALLAAGAGGAWAYKEYGLKYLLPGGVVSGEQIVELKARLAKLEANGGGAKQAVGDAAQAKAFSKAIDGLNAKVTGLSADVVANRKALAANAEKLATLEASIAGLKTALAKAAKTSDQAAKAAANVQLADMTKKITGLEHAIAALKAAPAVDNSKEVANLRQQVAALQTALEKSQAEVSNSYAQFNKKLADLASKAATPKADLASELARDFTVLRARVNAGQPFVSELDKIAALIPQAKAIDTLRQEAATGVPTIAALRAALEKVRFSDAETSGSGEKATEKSPAQSKEKSGLLSALSKNLSGLVKVSKVGETDWKQAKATAMAALEAGQVGKALEALSAKDASKDVVNWLALAARKLRADAALDQISNIVMARLTRNN